LKKPLRPLMTPALMLSLSDGPMNAPLHATSQTLAPDYFSPGTTTVRGEVIASLWAIAYYAGRSYRFERERLGAPWVLVAAFDEIV
jgi:hypothetical protein